MTTAEQIELFVQQAAWLEAQYHREIRRARANWKRISEIHLRTAQLNREFTQFMEAHQND